MDKEKLMNFIKGCRASGKDPHSEAMKRFSAVMARLELNTPMYRMAWAKPTGFYVLHTTQEAIDILIAEMK